ncbi:flagellar hook-associated protein 2 [Pseudomonas guineae]|uniref:Flagellar hook-associated protein 2 n=1 Tax=Pseudomonas guineae TaxID=425504 RepID=A0A1I3CZS2_9PSED|nr:flagellar filament capping protein FliD [Pseudomonas guineae]SFH80040.1 flagellar hook-associated protein 2 [Pseudomonas guineae]
MAGITGIGSGIDIDSIVKAMVNAEQAPKQSQLGKLESKTTTQLTSLGQLKGAISGFQTALAALNSPSQFLARTASSSDNKVLAATASQSAPAGSYKLEVTQLASSSKVALAAVPSVEGITLSSGTLSIKVGATNVLDVVVDASNNTLAGLRDAINKAAGGVSASIVTDDQGSRLVLSGSKSGDGNDITVSVVGGAAEAGQTALNTLAFSGNPVAPDATAYPDGTSDANYIADMQTFNASGKVITAAQSSKITVDGLSITRDTNTIDKVIDGVSLDLKTLGTSTLTIAQDQAGVKANVQKFADAYNTMIGFINSATKVTVVNDTSAPVTGALLGDSSVRSLVNMVRSELTTVQGDGAFRVLADLGVTTQKDGTLKVDSTILGKAISADFDGIAGYFTGDTGLAARLSSKLAGYTDSGGILEQRTDSLQATLSKVDKQKTELATRMTSLTDRLYKQYNAMDALVGQLKTTSDSLTSLFENMPGVVSNNK